MCDFGFLGVSNVVASSQRSINFLTLGSCSGKGFPPCIPSKSTVNTSPGLGGGIIAPAPMESASLG